MPNASSGTGLPSPRHLITSIFNSLPRQVPTPDLSLPAAGSNSNSNVLRTLSATHRSLLVTLHVLFPSLLLQALDLLDRGLVTKAIQAAPTTPCEPEIPAVGPPQAPSHLPGTGTDPDQAQSGHEGRREGPEAVQEQGEGGVNSIYLVRSAQPTHSRSGSSSSSSSSRYGTAPGATYVVRLTAWNCSCAAFAFSAFPASTSGPFSPSLDGSASGPAGEGRKEDAAWEFGGVSADGTAGHGDGVPACKHLMACLLAERWEGVLGAYVKHMRVGREEMAGLGADGGV